MTPMVVQCSSCLTEFELDPRKVPTNGVRARCSVCSAVIAIPAPPSERSEEHASQSEAGQPSTNRPPAPGAPVRTEPSAPPVPQPRAPQPEAATPSIAAMGASGQSPAAPPAAAAAAAAPAPTAPVAPPAPAPSPAPQTPTPAGGVSRRPINPFLSKDPALRAKRLARALVSDIVAYHPARHAEGLREGTLKTLFRDEIKKSYEEYVDQVGRDFASSTTHFQDALNDVLAGGKKMF